MYGVVRIPITLRLYFSHIGDHLTELPFEILSAEANAVAVLRAPRSTDHCWLHKHVQSDMDRSYLELGVLILRMRGGAKQSPHL